VEDLRVQLDNQERDMAMMRKQIEAQQEEMKMLADGLSKQLRKMKRKVKKLKSPKSNSAHKKRGKKPTQ